MGRMTFVTPTVESQLHVSHLEVPLVFMTNWHSLVQSRILDMAYTDFFHLYVPLSYTSFESRLGCITEIPMYFFYDPTKPFSTCRSTTVDLL